MSSWTIDTTRGHVSLPALPDRALVEHLLSTRSRKAWAKVEGLARQHAGLIAERARIESVEIPTAKATEHERAVEAVRSGRPVEHVPTTSALNERAARLAVEANAVLVVLGEALDELHQSTTADQAKMVRQAFEACNAALVDEKATPEARLDRVLLLTWATFVDVDPEWPKDTPEVALVRAARATLDEAPGTAARRVVQQAVDLGHLTAQAEPAAQDAA